MGLSKGKINIQKLNRRLEHMKYLDVLQIIILKWSEGMDMIYLAKQKENWRCSKKILFQLLLE